MLEFLFNKLAYCIFYPKIMSGDKPAAALILNGTIWF